MIQRIQTVYLLLAITLVSIVGAGVNVFKFIGENVSYEFSSFGLIWHKNDSSELNSDMALPLYILAAILVVLLIITMLTFKKLKRQFELARFTFFFYTLLVTGLVVYTFFPSDELYTEPVKLQIGIGYYLFIIGYIFSFMAMRSVKKDKALVDSLNRLR